MIKTYLSKANFNSYIIAFFKNVRCLKKLLPVLLFMMFYVNGLGQTTIWTEDFSTANNYSVTQGGEGSDGDDNYFYRTDGTDINISYSSTNGDFFTAQDIDDGGWTGSANPSELTWTDINISGYSNISFSGSFASAATAEIDEADSVHVQYQIDNGGWNDLIWFNNDGSTYSEEFLEDTDFDGIGEGTDLNKDFSAFTESISGTGSTMDLRITIYLNAGGEDFAFDDFTIEGFLVDNPSSFSATASSTSEVELDFGTNSNGDDVVIVYDYDGSFSSPSGTPPSAGNSFAGGTVVYKGTSSPQTHDTLSAGTDYYYKAWSYDGSDYSSGIEANDTTLKNEPSEHVTNFTAAENGFNQIDLSWTDATGSVTPDAYVIKANKTGSFSDPTDGTEHSEDADLSDGTALVKVSQGTENHSFNGLSASTQYYFKIWPYTNSGSDIDFKTDGTVPTDNVTTASTPLVINEILADPAGDANDDGTVDSGNDEFVELVNRTGGDLDVSGWEIHDEIDLSHTVSSSTILADDEALVIFGGGTPSSSIPGEVQTSSEGGLDLNNSGDTVKVYNDKGSLVTSYGYDSEGGDAQSLARNPDFTGGFDKHTNISSNSVEFSPGEDNTDGSALPVELISFHGNAEQDHNIIRWSTASEQNNDFFTLERSLDGKEFDVLTTVDGAGNSNEVLKYEARDHDVGKEVIYYRLKQTDYDGQYSYSDIISVKRDEDYDAEMTVDYGYGQNNLKLNLQYLEQGPLMIEMYDMMGRQIKQEKYQVRDRYKSVDWNISEFDSGIYILKVTNNQKTWERKLMFE